jgi:hypothetical protein
MSSGGTSPRYSRPVLGAISTSRTRTHRHADAPLLRDDVLHRAEQAVLGLARLELHARLDLRGRQGRVV